MAAYLKISSKKFIVFVLYLVSNMGEALINEKF